MKIQSNRMYKKLNNVEPNDRSTLLGYTAHNGQQIAINESRSK